MAGPGMRKPIWVTMGLNNIHRPELIIIAINGIHSPECMAVFQTVTFLIWHEHITSGELLTVIPFLI